MQKLRFTVAITLTSVLLSGVVLADGHVNPAVTARQSLMKLYVHNIGLLGGMAQGKIDYNAGAAERAAANLAALATQDQSRMWPQGTDSFELGKATRAKPEIWSAGADVEAIHGDLMAATAALAEVAGKDLSALQGAMGPVGKACGACHKLYREPKE